LTYLRRLPVHAVKIDRSFVAGLGGGSRDNAIVEAVTSLAGTLDLDVIAEGVETQEQRDILWTLGCRRAQGFHFARPQTAEAITGLLHARGGNRPSPGLSG
jgi:EAL domain-containing protein (putative c-di-GMP-specific phosphodiesterase class I)